MTMPHAAPDCDLSAVVVCGDDEERIGHVVKRLAAHLRSLELRFEILAVDEGSGDNTLAILALVRKAVPELEVVVGVSDGKGLARGAERARGRALLLLDARTEAPLPAIGFALARLDAGYDAVSLPGRCLLLRRTRTWRAFDSLQHHRDLDDLSRRFARRARHLGLQLHVATGQRSDGQTAMRRLRDLLQIRVARRA